MTLWVLLCLCVFAGLILGLGLPLVANLHLAADEKLCLGAAFALIALYLAAFGIYILDLPLAVFIVLPLAALVFAAARFRRCVSLLRTPSASRMLGLWLIWAGWSLGFLTLVRNYSGLGSGVIGDWMEHYQRAEFFLFHWPLPSRFIRAYSLTARPPLANLATGAFLALTKVDFASYQVFSTLESSLVFLPALLFVGRMTRLSRRHQYGLLLLFMVNPLLMHNGTYPWTKLITTFFVLTALYFFVRSRETSRNWLAAGAFVCLGAGFLAHYSAGPYLVALVVAWFWWRRSEWYQPRFWRATLMCAVLGGLLLATWFAWSINVYGFNQTFLSNSSVIGAAPTPRGLLAEKGLNFFNTLVPPPLRHTFDHYDIPKSGPIFVRDYAFTLYQLNLFFAVGSTGGILLCRLLWKASRQKALASAGLPRAFWSFFIFCTIVVGIGVNGGRDDWGLTYICLQPLVVLGVTFLAAHFGDLKRPLRILLVAGLIVDFGLGVILHFYVEHLNIPFSLWFFDRGRSLTITDGPSISFNVLGKHLLHLEFLGDQPFHPAIVITCLGGLFALALLGFFRGNSASPPFVRG